MNRTRGSFIALALFVSAHVIAAARGAQERFAPLFDGSYIGLQAEVGAVEFRAIEVSTSP